MTNQPCGHDTRYIVQAEDGTAFCAVCEREALLKQASEHEQASARKRKQAARLGLWILAMTPDERPASHVPEAA